MSFSSFFARLFTVSKHADPAVAAAVQPTLDAAHATVVAATSAISPALDTFSSKLQAAADEYTAAVAPKNAAGEAMTAAEQVVVSLGLLAGRSYLEGELAKFGVTAPVPAAT